MNNNKGFTLMEMILVLFIIGILVAIAYPSLAQYRENAIVSEGAKLEKVINKAIIQYYALQGRYPDPLTAAGYDIVVVDGAPEKKINSSGMAVLNNSLGAVTGVTLTPGVLNYQHVYYYKVDGGGKFSIKIDKP